MGAVWLFIKEWFREWWGLMGCAAFTFLGIYIAAANKSNVWVVGSSAALGAVLFFIASYKSWKRQFDAACDSQEKIAESKRQLSELLAPKLRILYEYGIQPYHHDNESQDTGKVRLIRIAVRNISHKSVDDVGCKLTKIDNATVGECLPLPLQHMHKTHEPLAPEDHRWIDVAYNIEHKDIQITHSVQGLQIQLSKPPYRITLFAHGKDCSCEQVFTLSLDQYGLVRLEPVSLGAL